MEDKFRNYLLGNLPEAETEKIDIDIISGKVPEEDLQIAEHDLIENYLEKSLTANEVELFHKNFLLSREREMQLEFISQLKSHAKSAEPALVVESEPAGVSFIGQLQNLLSGNPARAVFAILIVGIVVGLIWISLSGPGNLNPLEQEYAKLNASVVDPEKYPNLKRLELVAGTTRSGGDSPTIDKDQLTDSVLFNLVQPSLGAEGNFKVELLQQGRVLFTQNEIPMHRAQVGGEFRFLLPSSLFEKGDFEIRVSAEDGQTTLVFPFTVE